MSHNNPTNEEIKTRLESRIVKSQDENACWSWHGSHSKGYAMTTVRSKTITATRAILKFIIGIDVPLNKVVMHTCDNSWCVNPKHLVVDTQKANVLDANKKGIFKKTYTKLTDEQLESMNNLRNLGLSTRALAAEFRITRAQVYSMLRKYNNPSREGES